MADEKIKYICKGPRKEGADWRLGEHVPCGADLTALVESFPHDGEEHAYECPKCKIPHSVRRMP